mmetsp:Transcript_142389/g.361552  ORF Transcript_142389/g.361552 Transcript_142389/m.361552 type:complete len:830 (-) Transcript_142389:177-2666(-)
MEQQGGGSSSSRSVVAPLADEMSPVVPLPHVANATPLAEDVERPRGSGSTEAWVEKPAESSSPRRDSGSNDSSAGATVNNSARSASRASAPLPFAPLKFAISRLSSTGDLPPAGPTALSVNRFLQANVVQILMLVLTVAVLYCGDFVQAVADVSYDSGYSALLWVCLVCFSAEYVLNIIASAAQTPRYVGSLFFFLDFVATMSIAVDIIVLEANDLAEGGPVARAARAARVGTRAGRSLRLMRLMRFLRLVRITRVVKTLLSRRVTSTSSLQDDSELEGSSDMTRADTIGAQIGAATTKKVIIQTLMLLTMISLLERSSEFQVCSGELISSLEAFYQTDRIGSNCTLMQLETGDWFQNIPGSITGFSKQSDQGLTERGLIYAVIRGCELFADAELVGAPADDPSMSLLVAQRRGTEIQAVPCDAKFVSSDRDGHDDRSLTYFLYDMRSEMIEEAVLSMALTTVIVVALLGFSIIFSSDAEGIANQLVVPIRQLMHDMSHTAKLELDKVTPIDEVIPSEVFEVRSLQTAFHNLNQAVRSFSKFTPLEVVRHFLSLGAVAQLGVTERNVSIFFSDIAGWTTICEATQPVEVLALLSEYFESMVSIIIEEQGTMLEFIGDAILAIWNAPNDVPDHAVRSISSALRMNQALEDLRRSWVSQGKPEVRIRVGLHSAQVFVGNLGSNMRMKYGVLGDGVNLASRLEELNKRYKTDAMISEDVLNQPAVGDTFLVRPLDAVVVKGRRNSTRVYEILGFRASASENIRQVSVSSAQAMQAYLNRDFQQAIQCLQHIEQLKGGDDPAGKVLSDRCAEFLRHAPPPNWDGSEVLKEKTF